ncbi:MAG: FAD-dependent oxidoreductase, partial [Rhodospirillaceae bacterium]|nr:FAD-dependent oxidoreductase [Rhodospirillaceae bacterium]
MALPTGVSESDWSAALQALTNVVGSEWVFTEEEHTSLYHDVYSIYQGEPEDPVVPAAVAPYTAEEVQQCVRIANQYKIPIYPISTGKNLGYGGSAPVYSGSVVLDLKRMNRILNVDVEKATVLVEPGVTFYDIIRHFESNNMPLTLDMPDPAWGSLIGNALERGMGHT